MKKKNIFIILYIVLVIGAFAAILIIPQSREIFKSLSGSHPFLMGFAKFAFLALSGEFIALKMATGEWKTPVKIIWRFIIWGLIGVWITYMMKMFSIGVESFMSLGLLPGGNIEGMGRTFLKALFTSMTMNLSFGPTFMAIHKCTDTILELRSNKQKVTVKAVMKGIDWTKFASFTILKTVPLFWIPAHTITFMLPAEYQVMMAAALSVALGIILNLKKKKD